VWVKEGFLDRSCPGGVHRYHHKPCLQLAMPFLFKEEEWYRIFGADVLRRY